MKKEIKEFLLGTSIMWIPLIRYSNRKYTMRNAILKEVRRIMEDEKIQGQELQFKNQEFINILKPMLSSSNMFLYALKLEQLTYLFPERNSLDYKKVVEDLKNAVATVIQLGGLCLELYKNELSGDSQNHK